MWTHDLFLTKPYFFAFLACMNLVYLLNKGVMNSLRNQAVFLLLLSGLGHLAIYFICADAADYRYSSWLIFYASLASLLTLFGLWEEWQEKWAPIHDN
jgi:hypothetical protein